MAYETIKTIEIGESEQLEPNAKIIRVEQANEKLFNRVYGDVVNPECKLVVEPTHYCVLIKNGAVQDIRSGGEYPIFPNLKKKLFGGYKKPDPVAIDVIFMSKTLHSVLKWGTAKPMAVRDTYTDVPCHLRAYGEIEFAMLDPMKFYLEIVGSDKSYKMEDLKKRIINNILFHLEPAMAKAINRKGLSYDRLDEEKLEISENVTPEIGKIMADKYGISLIQLSIQSMTIDDEDIEEIEAVRREKADEIKNKRDAKELAAELERLDDKAWQREILLKEIEHADKAKFYEVLKIIGESEGKTTRGEKRGAPVVEEDEVCPECGTPVDPNSKFCPTCGTRYMKKKAPKGQGASIKCPNCGAEVPAGSKFCPECGEKVETGPKFCPECGKEVPPGSKFCPECGHRF